MKREKEQINSKSGFADPARIKEQRELDKPVDGKKSPWDFRCPQYDQRSSNFINAGTYYGKGVNQPVGSFEHTMNGAVPVGRVNTMRTDEEG
jgi:hypothetical protein